MSRLPSRVTIELAPADARRLVALTEQRKGYDSAAHREDVASDLLRAALDSTTAKEHALALIASLTDSAAFYRSQLELPAQSAEDRSRWSANIARVSYAASLLSTLIDSGVIS